MYMRSKQPVVSPEFEGTYTQYLLSNRVALQEDGGNQSLLEQLMWEVEMQHRKKNNMGQPKAQVFWLCTLLWYDFQHK